MNTKSFAYTIFFFMLILFNHTTTAQIQFGVFADCQYCDCETSGNRFYRNSKTKLDECIRQFNQNKNISFVVGLGDLIDRDFSSFDTINTVLATSEKEVFQVIGNHDLAVQKEFLEKVPEKLNLTQTWYSFAKKGWLFVFLDGNEITFNSNNPAIVRQAEEITQQLKKENKPNYHEWNGGIETSQLIWLEKQLQQAETKKMKVILFCHYPLLPLEAHTLWNSEEVLALLQKYNCVKLWLNGHNHAGNYAFQHGIHFVNLKGMVETENHNTFAEVDLTDKKITITAFGLEENRILGIE
jgi:predicted phosphodiesterase